MLRHKHSHHWGHSIFFRLLLIFGISGLLLIILVATSAHLLSNHERAQGHALAKNLEYYADYLVQEWGQPPDPRKLHKSAEELGFQVMVEKENQFWFSHQRLSIPPSNELHTRNGNTKLKWGPYKGTFYIVYQQNNYRYIFAVTHSPLGDNSWWFFLALAISIILVLGLAYGGVRRLLRPIHALTEGAEQIGNGKLDHQITVPRHGELKYVVQAFNDMALQIQRMIKNKEQLLFDVSHELRSPLTRMKLALEFVEDSKARLQLDSNLRTMEQMITELLESARMDNAHQALHLSSFDIGELIRDNIMGFAGRKPGIELSVDTQALRIEADRERLAIVLRNLLENALKYSEHQAKAVQIDWRADETLTLSVCDFGNGIPVEERQHVFEPFYRVDKSRQSVTGGYGLGLSLCKKIIEVHRGSIEIVDNHPNGSCIQIKLPLRQSDRA